MNSPTLHAVGFACLDLLVGNTLYLSGSTEPLPVRATMALRESGRGARVEIVMVAVR